mmetsp:Transcript_103943/g.300640  ORF Transcript_103943/g.300640 Transcript_103943/m.300640 type:complete len:206 (-) Transcript_103943:850-1467(-)
MRRPLVQLLVRLPRRFPGRRNGDGRKREAADGADHPDYSRAGSDADGFRRAGGAYLHAQRSCARSATAGRPADHDGAFVRSDSAGHAGGYCDGWFSFSWFGAAWHGGRGGPAIVSAMRMVLQGWRLHQWGDLQTMPPLPRGRVEDSKEGEDRKAAKQRGCGQFAFALAEHRDGPFASERDPGLRRLAACLPGPQRYDDVVAARGR